MLKTNSTGSWADLGDMSVACITRMDCTDGGTLMVWIKRLSDQVGGYLSTLKNAQYIPTVLQIAGSK